MRITDFFTLIKIQLSYFPVIFQLFVIAWRILKPLPSLTVTTWPLKTWQTCTTVSYLHCSECSTLRAVLNIIFIEVHCNSRLQLSDYRRTPIEKLCFYTVIFKNLSALEILNLLTWPKKEGCSDNKTWPIWCFSA